ncbi:LysM peptidoglycan-binding domain-containing protein [Oceanobacillus luteolus]|uniref:LysM peptidoglycan-binding domain-containing protein n=1 Tax=Oceanobacillus luteolus TaxID=1274358 RepID=UPI00255A29B1|nr:SafA/ExsA family spore coat assembly protein [Oceanobacillus luteolus]
MKIHIVQKGDTLWEIAKKYGVDFEELIELNSHLASPDMIMPGMKIRIPTHTQKVKQGDKAQVSKKTQPKQAPAPKKEIQQPKKEIVELPKMPTAPSQQSKMLPKMDNKYKEYPALTLPELKPAPKKKETVQPKTKVQPKEQPKQQPKAPQESMPPVQQPAFTPPPMEYPCYPPVMPMFTFPCPCHMPMPCEPKPCGCGGGHAHAYPYFAAGMHQPMYQPFPAQMFPGMMAQPMYNQADMNPYIQNQMFGDMSQAAQMQGAVQGSQDSGDMNMTAQDSQQTDQMQMLAEGFQQFSQMQMPTQGSQQFSQMQMPEQGSQQFSQMQMPTQGSQQTGQMQMAPQAFQPFMNTQMSQPEFQQSQQMPITPHTFMQPTENGNPFGDTSLQMFPEPPAGMRTNEQKLYPTPKLPTDEESNNQETENDQE